MGSAQLPYVCVCACFLRLRLQQTWGNGFSLIPHALFLIWSGPEGGTIWLVGKLLHWLLLATSCLTRWPLVWSCKSIFTAWVYLAGIIQLPSISCAQHVLCNGPVRELPGCAAAVGIQPHMTFLQTFRVEGRNWREKEREGWGYAKQARTLCMKFPSLLKFHDSALHPHSHLLFSFENQDKNIWEDAGRVTRRWRFRTQLIWLALMEARCPSWASTA